jgi:hypothetical protein
LLDRDPDLLHLAIAFRARDLHLRVGLAHLPARLQALDSGQVSWSSLVHQKPA